VFVINGRIKVRAGFGDSARKLEQGIGRIASKSPGFRGYYVVQTGPREGDGILVFDDASDWKTVESETADWFTREMAPMCDGEPEIRTGEVIVAIEQDMARTPGVVRPAAEPRAF
jgi:hypothetical protein